MAFSTDQQQINLVLHGHTHAFAVLVERYKDMVFTLALKMLKNREEAEEVAQDAFLKVYKSLNSYKQESKFSTWLYKITYNTCLDRIRKNNRQQNTIDIESYSEAALVSSDDIIGRMEDMERKQLIRECLNLLPGEDGFLLMLYYFEEQTVKEISKIMDITVNHVKIKLHRSRKKLATLISYKVANELMVNYEN